MITDEIGGWVKPRNENSVVRPFIMSHGTVACRDMKATRKFYEEFLGLECVRHSKASMVFRCGLRFHVACVELGEHCPDSGLHNHWGLDVLTREDVDRVHEQAVRLKDAYGIREIQEPVLQRGAYSFYMVDLDSNWWEIQYYEGFRHDDHFDFGDRFSMDDK
jgi:catechol 2,3-dioxygenase-like lactoylglutathione lyase family enzyme